MIVIGTAGHIDHGKSTLVRRLTGIDPDRLEEEQRRGMTIDLGFAWLTLPSGFEVSIVDVPGHERFVKNMLAGAGGIDVALLVVAADEGAMPQTREHLGILDLLGLKGGVIVLTKADLVDEEWLELAREDVSTLVKGTVLASARIVPVSSTTGSGIEELLRELDSVVGSIPEREEKDQAYMPIDRVFSVPGFGTVATGTLHNGPLQAGGDLEVVPGGKRVRIRGLQTHGKDVNTAEAGSRVAVNVAGISRAELVRGDVLAPPGHVDEVRRFDGSIRVLPDAPFPLVNGMQVSLHVGAAERAATLSILGSEKVQPGDTGWVQLRCREPFGGVRGQPFILRLPAPARTIAGGEIIDLAPRHRRSNRAAINRLENLATSDLDQVLVAALSDQRPYTAAQLRSITGANLHDVSTSVQHLVSRGKAVKLDNVYLGLDGWSALRDRARRTLQEYHTRNPLRRGIAREELRRRTGLAANEWAAAVTLLAQQDILKEIGTVLSLPTHHGGTAERRADADRVLQILGHNPFSPPTGHDLYSQAGVEPEFLSAMVEEGSIVRILEDHFLAGEAYRRMVCAIVNLIEANGEVTVAQVRDSLNTSRKHVVSLLEHLDAERVTRRRGDARVLGSRRPECV